MNQDFNNNNGLGGQNGNDFYSPQPEPNQQPYQQPMNQDYQQQPMQQPYQQPMQQQYQQPNMDYNQQPMQQDFQQPLPQQYQQYETPKSNSGKLIILVIIGGIILFALIVWGISILFKGVKNNLTSDTDKTLVFEGDGYTFNYSTDWVNGKHGSSKAIKRNSDNTILAAVGSSAFDEDYTCDIKDDGCQTTVYVDFYSFLTSELKSQSLVPYKNDKKFEKLKDDVYIAYYDYGKSTSNITGRYYVVVSGTNNAMFSFVCFSDKSIVDVDGDIREILETLDIKKKEMTNKAREREIAETLESMNNWNMYSGRRKSSTISTMKSIDGGWRILSDANTYWVFKNGEFYWYKDYEIVNDNYWYGTYTYLTGKEGLKSVGIDEDRLDNIIAQSKGKVSSGDVYAMILTPNKVITGGVDKTSTNLQPNTTWKFVWILVDHGDEGIEAQVVNLNNADTAYYVKVVK